MRKSASASTEATMEEIEIVRDRSFKSFEEAEPFYLTAMQRLKDVNNWNILMKAPHERFSLLGSDAKPKLGHTEEGDFICIKFEDKNDQNQGEDVLHVERIVTKLLGHKRSIAITTIPVRLIITPNSTERVVYSEVSYTFVVQVDETLLTAGLYMRF